MQTILKITRHPSNPRAALAEVTRGKLGAFAFYALLDDNDEWEVRATRNSIAHAVHTAYGIDCRPGDPEMEADIEAFIEVLGIDSDDRAADVQESLDRIAAEAGKRVRVSFRLSQECVDLIDRLANKKGVSKTAIIEMAVREIVK